MMSVSVGRLTRTCLMNTRTLGAALVLGAFGMLAACGGGSSSSSGGSVTAPTLDSIAVTAAPASVAAGNTSQLSAVGTYSDHSTQTLTTTVTWSSATTSVATIAASGVATAVAPGTTVITATSGSVSGTTTLTVTAATPKTIAVTPPNPSITKGATEQFTAMATLSDGTTQDVTTTATWSSATTTVATVVATTGLATGTGVGSSVISAAVGSVSGSTTLTVTAPPLTGIAVYPANPIVINGATNQLSILGSYSDGSTAIVAGTSGTWTSSNAAVATVGAATGVAAGLSVGATLVGVSYGGFTITANLNVTTAEFAFVTNFGDNTVSAFSVGANDSLVANGAPVGAGSQPFALVTDTTGHYLYIADFNGQNPGSIYEYSIGANGQLTPLPIASITGGSGQNGMALYGSNVYIANLGGNTISHYVIGAGGQLGAPVTVSAGTGAGPASITISTPTATTVGTYAYVPNFTAATISVFSVNTTTGALSATPVSTTPVPTGSLQPLAAVIDTTGTYLYVADGGNGTVQAGDVAQYAINADGSLTALNPAVVATGGNSRSIAVDAKTNTVYVSTANADAVHVFAVGTGGQLTETSTLALASGSNPNYIAIDPTDTLLYAPQRGGGPTGQVAPFNNTVAQFGVSATGALSTLAAPTISAGSGPAQIAFSLAY